MTGYPENSTEPVRPGIKGKLVWTRRQRLAYQRLKTGLTAHNGQRLRFMTLTTAPGMIRSLEDSWNILRLCIKRQWGGKYAYFKVKTKEGVAGVLHILYFGRYLPKSCISNLWKHITGTAYVVDIRACKQDVSGRSSGVASLARYCISQYVTGGQSEFYRFSYSHDWAFRGIGRRWKAWKTFFTDIRDTISAWEKCILSGKIPGLAEELTSRQVTLSYG